MAESTTIYVNKLSPFTTEKDLSLFFDKYGRIEKATIIRHKETGDSKCYGFVQFETSQEANDALSGADGSEIKGSAISVEPTQDRPAQHGGFRGRGRGRPRDGGSSSYSSRGGGYSRGGYGRPREYDSGRSGGRDSFEPRGRGRGRGGMSRGGQRSSSGYGGEERYGGVDKRSSDRYERSEDRYNENGYRERYSSDTRGGDRRPRGEWQDEELEEPRERRSSFSRGGRGNPRGGYNSRGRGDYGRQDRESSRGSFSRGGSERGGFSRRGGGDRGGYSGQERHGRPERGPRDDNRDWYGVSDRRSGGDDRHSSGGGERYSRHRDDDSGYSRGGRGRGAPRGRGRGRGSFSGRGSLGGGSNRSFGEDY